MREGILRRTFLQRVDPFLPVFRVKIVHEHLRLDEWVVWGVRGRLLQKLSVARHTESRDETERAALVFYEVIIYLAQREPMLVGIPAQKPGDPFSDFFLLGSSHANRCQNSFGR